MITHTVRCKLCYNYATSSVHTYCNCGLVLLGASDEVKKQVLKHVINCFSMLTSSTCFQTGTALRENIWIAVKDPSCVTRREIIEKAVQKRSRAISAKRLVSIAAFSHKIYNRRESKILGLFFAEKDHKENTSLQQQNANVGQVRTS